MAADHQRVDPGAAGAHASGGRSGSMPRPPQQRAAAEGAAEPQVISPGSSRLRAGADVIMPGAAGPLTCADSGYRGDGNGEIGDTSMDEWQAGAGLDQLSDTPPNGIPVVRDQLWTSIRVPAETHWEPPPPPRSRWAQLLDAVRLDAPVFAIIAFCLCGIVAISLFVIKGLPASANGTTAVAGSGHQERQNPFVPGGSAQPKRSAQHGRSAPRRQPAGQPVFRSLPGLSLFTPTPVAGLPSPSSAPAPAPSPSPAPTPSSSPTSPPPTSPPPTSPPPTSPPPTPRHRRPRPRRLPPPTSSPSPTDVPTPTQT